MLVEGEEDEVEFPESSNPRDHLLVSGDQVVFSYSTGCMVCIGSGDTEVSCSIICVAEVEEQLLVAIPSAVWHRKVKNRLVPSDMLRKPVAILAAAQSSEDPETAGDNEIRVWLGLLNPKYEEDVSYGEEIEVQHIFGVDSAGNTQLPFAQALVAAARDHFSFVTAESGQNVPAPPGLAAGPAGSVEGRLSALESGIMDIQQGLQQLLGQRSAPAVVAPKTKRKPAPSVPPGMDPGVVQQALQAGVSKQSLEEMMKILGKGGAARAVPPPPQHEKDSSSEDDAIPVGDGSGSADPLAKAVVSLSKIVGQMHKEKVLRRDKGLEAILDRAESGSAKEPGTSTRSKAAALRSLQSLLHKDPRLIYEALERHLQEDWDLAQAQANR